MIYLFEAFRVGWLEFGAHIMSRIDDHDSMCVLIVEVDETCEIGLLSVDCVFCCHLSPFLVFVHNFFTKVVSSWFLCKLTRKLCVWDSFCD